MRSVDEPPPEERIHEEYSPKVRHAADLARQRVHVRPNVDLHTHTPHTILLCFACCHRPIDVLVRILSLPCSDARFLTYLYRVTHALDVVEARRRSTVGGLAELFLLRRELLFA